MEIVDPMLIFEFIHRIIDILTDYLGDVSETSIRDNFVTVYQVRNMLSEKVKEQEYNFIVAFRGNDRLRVSLDNRA